jgi:hypothetical protein
MPVMLRVLGISQPMASFVAKGYSLRSVPTDRADVPTHIDVFPQPATTASGMTSSPAKEEILTA